MVILVFLTLQIATIYEVILFGFALYKYMTARDLTQLPALRKVMILSRVLVNDNILYFIGYDLVFFTCVPRSERVVLPQSNRRPGAQQSRGFGEQKLVLNEGIANNSP